MSEHIKYQMNASPLSDITLENICGTEEVAPVSYWAPRREEIQRFVDIAKAVHTGEGKPRVLDIGCGSGLLAYLLAETGEVDVIGLDPEESLIEGSPYSHPNLQLEVGDSKDAVGRYSSQDFDVALNSWMPGGLNLTPDIRDIGAKVIIYIKEMEATGVPDYAYSGYLREQGIDPWEMSPEEKSKVTAQEDYVSYEPGNNYTREFEWSGPACSEIQGLGRKLKDPNAYIGMDSDLNFIDIQFRKDIPIPEIPKINISDSDKYAWEADLERVKGPVENIERFEEFSW